MDLYNEVKIDFSGAVALANSMRAAYQDTARMRREITLLQRDSQQVARNLTLARMPGLPTAAGAQAVRGASSASGAGMTTAEKAALFGTAAGGSAFFYRATNLANPAAMSRFNMAIEDTTAVIDHQMVPALERMTRLVRGFGDFLAAHPILSRGIGFGAIGLTGLALAGSAYQGLKFAGQGLRGAFNAGRTALGFGDAAAQAGGSFAGELAGGALGGAGAAGGISGGRSLLAQRQVESFRAEERAKAALEAARQAEKASGGYGAGPEVARAAQAAEAELASIRAARGVAVPPPLPAAARAGRLARFGSYLGRGARFLQGTEFLGPAMDIAAATAARSPEELISAADVTGMSTNTYRALVGPQTRQRAAELYGPANRGYQNILGFGTFKRNFGFSPNPFDWFGGGSSSSYGAAARPAEYQDVLGSVLSMRQAIASGSSTSDVKDNTDALSEVKTALEELSRQMAAANAGNNGRGTRNR